MFASISLHLRWQNDVSHDIRMVREWLYYRISVHWYMQLRLKLGGCFKSFDWTFWLVDQQKIWSFVFWWKCTVIQCLLMEYSKADFLVKHHGVSPPWKFPKIKIKLIFGNFQGRAKFLVGLLNFGNFQKSI